MSQPPWVQVALQSDVPESDMLPVYPKGVAVLLVRLDDGLFAIANRCPHMACPLEAGRLVRGVLTCPCHDWSFHVRTGEMVKAPELRLTTFPVRVEGDDVYVQLPGE